MLKTVTNLINASQIQTPITLPGNVTLSTGNLIIGTSGKGIDFSATPGTGTSELLSDYEEGTWTPTTNGDATGAFSSAEGVYTRVGNLVTVTGFFIVSANFAGTKIGGLPFTCRSGFGGTGSNFTAAVLPAAGTTAIYASANGGATTIEFAAQNYATGHSPNTTTLAYKFTLTYMV
jgi:hypothetical protein